MIFNTFSGFLVSVVWFVSGTSFLADLLVSAGEGSGVFKFWFWFRFFNAIILVIVSWVPHGFCRAWVLLIFGFGWGGGFRGLVASCASVGFGFGFSLGGGWFRGQITWFSVCGWGKGVFKGWWFGWFQSFGCGVTVIFMVWGAQLVFFS